MSYDTHLTDETVTPARPHRPSRWRRATVVTGVTALALTSIATGLTFYDRADAAVDSTASVESTLPSTDDTTTQQQMPQVPGNSDGGIQLPGRGSSGSGSGLEGLTLPDGSSMFGDGQTSTTQDEATIASTEQSTGIVLIDTVLAYESGEAAGSGMVLTSDGLVLTNNHVIEGATEITVTIGTTGETYTAEVLGTDSTNDVALLQLEGASGLTTVTLDDDGVAVGDEITAVGNAEGGGVLMAAEGTVTELDSSVTTSDELTASGETLGGMIQFSADVVSGDSGGALMDDEGEVIGMTTAASTGLSTTIAFAVPIEDAMVIAQQINAGDESGTVSIGYKAMLGIAVGADTTGLPSGWSDATTTAGAQVQYVYEGTPAEEVGLVAGDTITALDGASVSSASELTDLIGGYEPGDSAELTWITTSGEQQQGTIVFDQGPAS
ncbi:S1C family serine protease [Demequina sp.]|uniref:S1C family serine protease n=1 Tax=Demequina sp. TaxID=2050685 RepID=UPI003A87B6A0